MFLLMFSNSQEKTKKQLQVMEITGCKYTQDIDIVSNM